MPIFDFMCLSCGNKFDIMISNTEKNKVKCPECNSRDIKQMLSRFNTGGTVKSKPISSSCQGCSAGASSG